jgi:hypothetical protein
MLDEIKVIELIIYSFFLLLCLCAQAHVLSLLLPAFDTSFCAVCTNVSGRNANPSLRLYHHAYGSDVLLKARGLVGGG